MDPSNPWHVHHSYHPGHILVPTKLNGANYSSMGEWIYDSCSHGQEQNWLYQWIYSTTFRDQTTDKIRPMGLTKRYDFIMANSLRITWFSQRGHSCQDNLASVGRFQRSIFIEKWTFNLPILEIFSLSLTRYHDSFNVFHKN